MNDWIRFKGSFRFISAAVSIYPMSSCSIKYFSFIGTIFTNFLQVSNHIGQFRGFFGKFSIILENILTYFHLFSHFWWIWAGFNSFWTWKFCITVDNFSTTFQSFWTINHQIQKTCDRFLMIHIRIRQLLSFCETQQVEINQNEPLSDSSDKPRHSFHLVFRRLN